ncbi:MAG: RnfABCDGE type electron transport complex subunit B [Provencibacterium sp.]|jgi:electron transport complex protein RnfB|nr:RnfABCDGE type electron transport complex subunit B [Provencibacterium sp.]
MGSFILPVVIVTIIGILLGLMLSFASKFFAVEVDERVVKVREALPGANCGGCGFAGCDEYAAKIAAGEAAPNLCTPGGAATARQISEVLGVSFEGVEEKKAQVRCRGHLGTTEYIMEYMGPKTCAACNSLYQGRRSCSHGCLGYGDCVRVCQYDAIHVVNGVAVVDDKKCTGCGMCAKECPDQLIQIVPAHAKVYVGCRSTDKGAYTRKLCKNGCIGCMKCQKTCQHGAIKVEHNLAYVDPELCTGCGECIAVCPTQAIQRYE